MTIDRYEREIGLFEDYRATVPFGRQDYDTEGSPSFARLVADVEDVRWHGHAVAAMDHPSAGFANWPPACSPGPRWMCRSSRPGPPWPTTLGRLHGARRRVPRNGGPLLSRNGRSTLLPAPGTT